MQTLESGSGRPATVPTSSPSLVGTVAAVPVESERPLHHRDGSLTDTNTATVGRRHRSGGCGTYDDDTDHRVDDEIVDP